MSNTTPSETEKLRSALEAAVETIKDYLAYSHDGDHWEEDRRAMGEMDINDYGRDGRLDYALSLLAEPAADTPAPQYHPVGWVHSFPSPRFGVETFFSQFKPTGNVDWQEAYIRVPREEDALSPFKAKEE